MLWDINVNLFNFINHTLQNSFFDSFMPIMTHFGGFKFLFAFLLVIIIYSYIKNYQTINRIAVLALISLLLTDLVVVLLKFSVCETRPFVALDNVHLLISEDDPFSFPSGHTASTFSVVIIAVLNMKELLKKHYKIVNLILILFSVLIPFSRVYVGVHYPFDVLAGFIIASNFAFLINKYKDKIFGFMKI